MKFSDLNELLSKHNYPFNIEEYHEEPGSYVSFKVRMQKFGLEASMVIYSDNMFSYEYPEYDGCTGEKLLEMFILLSMMMDIVNQYAPKKQREIKTTPGIRYAYNTPSDHFEPNGLWFTDEYTNDLGVIFENLKPVTQEELNHFHLLAKGDNVSKERLFTGIYRYEFKDLI